MAAARGSWLDLMGCVVLIKLTIRSVVWFVTGVVLAVVATAVVTDAWRADAAAGGSDSTFVPMAPCRLFDFRAAPATVGPKGTPLGAGEANRYVQQVTGANGNCVIPVDAVAVSLNVTAVNPSASSFLSVFPDGETTPNASNLNWGAGQAPIPNKVDVKLSPAGRIMLYTESGTVGVIADAVGYYTSSTLQELASEVAALKAAQPFSVSNNDGAFADLTTTPKSYLDVTLMVPVAGQVIVNYSAFATSDSAGGDVVCAPYRSTEIPAGIPLLTAGVGWWETSTPTFGDDGSVSGTAPFVAAGGETVTYSLVCEETGSGQGRVAGRTMTAIFTPAP